MLRLFLFAAFLCACFQILSAQKVRKHQFGVHSGVSLTQIYLSSDTESVWEGSEAGSGFTLGLGYSWNFSPRWSLHLEANYMPLRAKGKQHSYATLLYAANFQDTIDVLTGDPDFDEVYLYMPVLVQFALDTNRRFLIGAGLHFQWFLTSESSFLYDKLIYGRADETLTPPYVAVNPPEDGGTLQYENPEKNNPGFTLMFQYNPVIGNRQFLYFNLGLVSNFEDVLGIKSREYFFRAGFAF